MNFYRQSFHMSPLMENSNFSFHQTDFNLRNIEPSHLQCHKADQDWTCEDSHVGSLMTLGDYSAFSGLPQDYSNVDSRTYGDARDSSEQLLQGHDISALEDDVLSYSLSPSDGESDVWSPSVQGADSLSPRSSTAKFTRHLYLNREEELFISTSQASNTRRNRSPSLLPTELEQPIVKEENSPSEAPILSPSSICSSRKSSAMPSPSVSTPVEDSDLSALKKKKAAHNAIEKRYRTNMNAKFVALGGAIPSFRTRPLVNATGVKGVRKSVRDGSQPQNKSEILTNALAYIQELQEENRLLQSELNVLKDNLLPGSIWRPCHGVERKW